jgi:hypothetical protein
MRRAAIVLLIVWTLGIACAFSRPRPGGSGTELNTATAIVPPTVEPSPVPATLAAPPPVPAEYASLYNVLGTELGDFEARLNASWDHSQGNTVFATELLYANGNVGEALLEPQMMDLNRTLLDRLQALGVKGVVVAIKFPLLSPSFPHSSDYLNFYKEVVAECHQRGIQVLVESGAIFSGTPYSTVHVDWSRYTRESFFQGLEDQLLLIASQVHPDYLTLANEPTTDAALTGFQITPGVWGAFLQDTAAKIDRSSGMRVGAGTGTWENPAFMSVAMDLKDLDYIDLHLYPLGQDAIYYQRALNYAQQARAAGKRVTISECWLYKASPDELGNGLGDTQKIMNRDVWAFWSPLEDRYVQDIMNLADATRMDFVSFFWARNFFAYLDYGATPHDLSTQEFNQRMNQTSLASLQAGNLSSLGQFLRSQLEKRASP